MNPELVVFVIFAIAAVAGAVTLVSARNPVYSAMGLLLTMFSMAVFYVLNDAHFVAAVQVIIYAGAVMTLFLFVIMLIGVDKEESREEKIPLQRPLVAVLGGGLILLVLLAGRTAWVVFETGNAPVGTIENVADELFGTWMLPFQATILLLTIAAVGSLALARYEGGSRSAGASSPARQDSVTASASSSMESNSDHASSVGASSLARQDSVTASASSSMESNSDHASSAGAASPAQQDSAAASDAQDAADAGEAQIEEAADSGGGDE